MKTKLLSVASAIMLSVNLFAQDGTLNLNFNSGGTGSDATPAIKKVEKDGKILISYDGAGSKYNGVDVKNAVRLNADGTVDNTFTQYQIATANSRMYLGDIQPISTGYIVAENRRVYGAMDFYNAWYDNTLKITRLNPDGTVDPFFSFTPQTSRQGGMASMPIQEYSFRSLLEHFNNKIVVAGTFFDYQSSGTQKYSHLARFDEDGSLDYSFNPGGTGPNNAVNKVIKNPEGKLYIAGNFTSYNGTAKRGIVRLNSNGTLDTTFNAAGAGTDNDVYEVAIQNDGKILISGAFTKYNGTSVNSIARINTDGSLDTTFQSLVFESATGGGIAVNSIVTLNDGKILVAGRFNKYNLVQTGSVGRLNNDGTLDTTFNPGGRGAKVVNGTTVTNANLTSMGVQPDGKIIFAGDFNYYNTNGTKKLFHSLNGTTPPYILAVNSASQMAKTSVYPNPSSGIFNIKNSGKISNVEIYDMTGKLVKKLSPNATQTEVNLTGTKGVYIVKSTSATGTDAQKVIIK